MVGAHSFDLHALTDGDLIPMTHRVDLDIERASPAKHLVHRIHRSLHMRGNSGRQVNLERLLRLHNRPPCYDARQSPCVVRVPMRDEIAISRYGQYRTGVEYRANLGAVD